LLDFWERAQRLLTGTRLARRAADAVFRAQARWHLARFDDVAAARCQGRILLSLLRDAQGTRFGRDHDFRRIRTVEDFRRLVPLCSRADLWRRYGQDTFHHLTGLPSPALLAAHRAALRTALAHVVHARPRARLLSGVVLALRTDGRGLPSWLRPYLVHEPGCDRPANEVGRAPFLTTGEDELRESAKRVVGQNVTCLLGSPRQLAALIEQVRQVSGRERLREVWPGLTAVLTVTGADGSSADSEARAQRLIRGALRDVSADRGGESAVVLEVALCLDGPVAVEDPRHGTLRLLPDHGVFFEFVPVVTGPTSRPERLCLDQVEAGRPYELVLTSPAGAWACRTGRVVVFERTEPPLVRFTDPVPQPALVPTQDPSPVSLGTRSGERGSIPLPHQQNGGIPATPPEKFVRNPWLIPVDRG
jgi:hypothetical protein